MLVEWTQFREVLVRLLEVVAQDLVELRLTVPVAVDALRPVHEALMHRRPGTLENSLIRRVTDQNVMEAVVEVACVELGPDELPLCHRDEVALDFGADHVWREVRDRCLLENEADHGGGLDHRAFLRREQVEPGGEERLDRAGDGEIRQVAGGHPAAVFLSQEPVVDHHRKNLLDEQRVPFSRCDDSAPNFDGERRVAEKVCDDEFAFLVGERLELDQWPLKL